MRLGSRSGLAIAAVGLAAAAFPALANAYLVSIAGTAIGVITGWLSAGGTRAMPLGSTAAQGAIAGGVAGVLGSLVSTALGDVPLGNMAIAGGSTFVAGAIGAAIGRAMTPAAAR